MKFGLPEGYPSKLDDNNIAEYIVDCAHQASKGQSRSQVYYQSMAQIGQNELAVRRQVKFIEETEALSIKIDELKSEISTLRENNESFGKRSSKLSRWTIFLAIVTMALAGTTIWFSFRDMESDKTWRVDQMTELKKTNELLLEQIRINEEVNVKLEEAGELVTQTAQTAN